MRERCADSGVGRATAGMCRAGHIWRTPYLLEERHLLRGAAAVSAAPGAASAPRRRRATPSPRYVATCCPRPVPRRWGRRLVRMHGAAAVATAHLCRTRPRAAPPGRACVQLHCAGLCWPCARGTRARSRAAKGRSWFPLSRTPLTKVFFSVFPHGSIRGSRRESSCRHGQFWRVRASRVRVSRVIGARR